MRNFKSIALLLMVLLGSAGCATVQQWIPQDNTQHVDEAAVEETTDEVVAIDLFKQSAKPLSAEHKQQLAALQRALEKGDRQAFPSVIEALLRLTGRAQTPSLIHSALGDAYAEVNDTEQAVLHWQHALEINPFNYFSHLRLASHYKGAGEFAQAEAHYDEAINAWQDLPEGYRNRGIFFDLYQGKKASALRDYGRYRELLVAQGESTQIVDRWIKEMQNAMDEN
ncbi:hypothetical protein [Alteromonas flava]|uniref:hypothetical protein n=1 Tax=Alteromonas flava TaxID=2048003 RepID=UPI000C28F0A5|nr:hypothetical protein [Alteromonas flava]